MSKLNLMGRLCFGLLLATLFSGAAYADATATTALPHGDVCVNVGSAAVASIGGVVAMFSVIANFVPATSSIGKAIHYLALNVNVG